jgi:hypothetical protein
MGSRFQANIGFHRAAARYIPEMNSQEIDSQSRKDKGR